MADGAKRKFSLNYLGAGPAHAELLPILAQLEIPATFYVCPEYMLANPTPWRSAIEGGNRLANGSLLSATDDGSLPLWNFDMLTQEMNQSDHFLREFGVNRVDAVFVPGVERSCQEGSYLPLLQSRYRLGLTIAGDGWLPSDLDRENVVTITPAIVNYFADLSTLPPITHFVIPSTGLNPMPQALNSSHEWLIHQLAMRSDEIDIVLLGNAYPIVRGAE